MLQCFINVLKTLNKEYSISNYMGKDEQNYCEISHELYNY